MTAPHEIPLHSLRLGANNPLFLIAGPCVIESESHARKMAEAVAKIAADAGIPYIFKASYDKANRTSLQSFRGPGIHEGLRILERIKEETGLPVLTDVHEAKDVPAVADAVDIVQIPAFLCRQTDLLVAAAKHAKCINIKKGQFVSPWDMKHVAAKIASTGNERILLTERGASFGYNTLVTDFRGLPEMARTGYPVVFDATHSVQQPGGQSGASGGQREYAPVLARAALAVGCAAIFMETHPDPDHAPSDGPNMIPLREMPAVLARLKAIDRVIKG